QSGTNWVVSTIAGSPGNPGISDGTNTNARFYSPSGIAADTNGILYVADTWNYSIKKITSVGGDWVVSTLAGLAQVHGSADGTGTNAQFLTPNGLTVDGAGNIYVADTGNNAIRRVTSAGVVRTIAGAHGSAG